MSSEHRVGRNPVDIGSNNLWQLLLDDQAALHTHLDMPWRQNDPKHVI